MPIVKHTQEVKDQRYVFNINWYALFSVEIVINLKILNFSRTLDKWKLRKHFTKCCDFKIKGNEFTFRNKKNRRIMIHAVEELKNI